MYMETRHEKKMKQVTDWCSRNSKNKIVFVTGYIQFLKEVLQDYISELSPSDQARDTMGEILSFFFGLEGMRSIIPWESEKEGG